MIFVTGYFNDMGEPPVRIHSSVFIRFLGTQQLNGFQKPNQHLSRLRASIGKESNPDPIHEILTRSGLSNLPPKPNLRGIVWGTLSLFER
jgi:hypothetical protein